MRILPAVLFVSLSMSCLLGGCSNVAGVEVLEVIDAGGYTYARLAIEGHSDGVWFAAPEQQLEVGDRVAMPSKSMPMNDFESPTLGRTFDLVYFESSFEAPTEEGSASDASGEDAGATAAAGAAHAGARAAGVDLSGIAPFEGGQTVAGVFALGKESAGESVAFRGRVVKFNAGILGKNWLHVQDGTGESGTDDLTVTTDATVAVGDLVVVEGTLTADKDFGAGYTYDLIIEDATVTIE